MSKNTTPMMTRVIRFGLFVLVCLLVILCLWSAKDSGRAATAHSNAIEALFDEPLSSINDDNYTLPQRDVDAALASTADGTVDVGDTSIVPGWEWVEVQNTDGVESGNIEFPFGDTCGVDEGHVIKAKAIDGDKVLVEYLLPYQAYGSPCPGGTLFFVDKQAFLHAADQYVTVRSDTENAKARVGQLLTDAS